MFKTRPIRTLAAVGLLALASAGAGAQAHRAPAGPVAPVAYTPRIDAEQAEQARRIAQGLARGQLTRAEARRLQRQQQQIQRFEGHAKADGVVTPRERAALRQMLATADLDIRRQLHDAQRTPGRQPWQGGSGWR